MGSLKVKKVSPYPIPVTIAGTSATFTGRIGKLTTVGVLVETDKPLGLGQQFNLTFTIPVINKAIQAVGVVIKTYARYGGELGKTKSHTLNEIHFRSLGDEQRIAIHSFLLSIRQV